MKKCTLSEFSKYVESFSRFFVSSKDNVECVGISYKFIFDALTITYMPTQVVLSNKVDALIVSDIECVEIDELVENKISVITFVLKNINEQSEEIRLKILAKK